MTAEELIARIDAQLAAFRVDYGALDLRQKVLRLVILQDSARSLGVAVVREGGCDAKGARERLRLYMVKYVGIPLDSEELAVVAGITEFPRRLRELRVEDGYPILTGLSSDPDSGVLLRPNQYLLLRAEPDREAARRWRIASRIRQEGGSASDRILRYLLDNVGHPVTSEELHYVAKISDYPRRIRELRTESGYPIATHYTGRPDLKPGEYVLEADTPVRDEHDRHISYEAQREVYARDNNTCRGCHWRREMWTPEDPRRLELHHVEEHVRGGANLAANLEVLCNRCHDDVHARAHGSG